MLSETLNAARISAPALPRPLRGVLFDLMDTLAYVPAETYDGRRQALARALGVETVDLLAAWDETRTNAAVGALENTQQRITDVARRLRVRVSPAVIEEEARLDDAMWKECVCLYPDALALLNAVVAKSLRVAIVTNGPLVLSPLKEQLGLTPYLYQDAFFLSSEIGETKPDPTIYERALAHLELQPKE